VQLSYKAAFINAIARILLVFKYKINVLIAKKTRIRSRHIGPPLISENLALSTTFRRKNSYMTTFLKLHSLLENLSIDRYSKQTIREYRILPAKPFFKEVERCSIP
jgi:hypothetical protein